MKEIIYSITELAIQPSLNASLMARNPNDAPSQVGQSSSSTSDQQQQAQAPQPTDINVAASSDSPSVKSAADAQATQVAASSMG